MFISSVTLRLGLGLVVGLGLGLIIPTCRANLVLRVIWQCDIFGMTLGEICTKLENGFMMQNLMGEQNIKVPDCPPS